ncbi:hypothetical protein [Mucilaginibacter sp. 22184]|uniref:hypothetical protein n=1 Tax=Mucilaginibacter sp. 22184 TaxID=3453887 RepID=UPI003F864B39
MKKYLKHLPLILLLCCGLKVSAQVSDALIQDATLKKIPLQKTLSGWDILGNLYQLSLDDITADDKSIKFKSTIFGLKKLGNDDPVSSAEYTRNKIARHIEPYLTFNYKDQFDPSNLTLGVNLSLINHNDKTESPKLTTLPVEIQTTHSSLNARLAAYRSQVTPDLPNATAADRNAVVALLNKNFDLITAFVHSGDETKLPPALKADLDREGITPLVKQLQEQMDKLASDITNGFNLTFSPQATYAFNRSDLQGASFMFNGIKGFSWIKKRTTQIIAKGGYVLGDDTVIKKTAIGRHQIQTQLGINQVFVTKKIKADDGTESASPSGELSISYGYNYLTEGYLTDEKRDQQTLSAKLGFLIGKDSWLLIPFTYNFATKEKRASVTIKVNLGSAPFK